MALRLACQEDNAPLSRLLMELGYYVCPSETSRRLAGILDAPDHFVWVSEGSTIDGFIHFFLRPSLDKDSEVVVQALVVGSTSRERGVGRQLMAKADAFAQSCRCGSISLYSGTQRTEAQKFYAHLGYERVGTSALLKKLL